MCRLTIAASCCQASCELLTLQAGMSQDGMLHSRLESDLLKCHCHSSCDSLLHKQGFSSCKVPQPSLLADGSWKLLQSCSLDVFMWTQGMCWGVSGLVCISLCMCVKILERGWFLLVTKLILLLPGVREPLNQVFSPKVSSDLFVEQVFAHDCFIQRNAPWQEAGDSWT